MKKQLVFYVHKIKTQDNKLFFCFRPNTGDEPMVWSDWDDQRGEPERIEKTFAALKVMLMSFSAFLAFKLEFQKGGYISASNPFDKNYRKQKSWLDHHLGITDKEESFWRKMFLDLSLESM